MDQRNRQPPAEPLGRARLESWKEIAAYFRRDVSTVQRWEKREGLPVHRHLHDKLGTVYADASELEAWWSNRRPRLELPPRSLSPRRLVWLGTAVALLAAAAGGVWHYLAALPIRRPELITRRVWAGVDVDRLGSVSPESRYLCYMNKSTDSLAVRDIATGKERAIAHQRYPSHTGEAYTPVFSPDGRRIAYCWHNQELSYDLRIVGADGSAERVVYAHPDVRWIEVADWSPDGRHLLATFRRSDRTNHIVLVAVADGAVRLLKSLDWRFPFKMSFSPDGRYVVYDFPPRPDSPNRDLFLLAVASGLDEAREIPLVEHPANDYLLGWVPGSHAVLFASDRTGTVDAWAARAVGGKPQGAPELIKKDLGWARPLGFTRNGAYYYALETAMADVYVGALQPATGRLLVPPAPPAPRFMGTNWSPDWSRDGAHLSYVSQRLHFGRSQGARRIVIRSLATNQERVLETGLNYVELARWSPDGRHFLVTGADHKYVVGVFRVDARTGEATPVVLASQLGTTFFDPVWSPDYQTVFYKRRTWGVEPSPLLTRGLTTGREKEFLGSVYRYSLSPDGRALAFSSFDEASEFIRIVPLSSGKVREVHRQPRGAGRIYSLAWTSDGTRLMFARKGQLWRLSAAGGGRVSSARGARGRAASRTAAIGRASARRQGRARVTGFLRFGVCDQSSPRGSCASDLQRNLKALTVDAAVRES